MPKFCLKVWGDYALFSRPEMKTERVSYDVITPSAARAIYESIFWKPPVEWVIEKIEVLKPIQWIAVRRNEVSDVVPASSARTAMKTGRGRLGIYIEEKRQQRASLILKDVAYRLHARMEFREELLGPDETPGKFYAMFERRAKAGQVFHRPYLGCREFAANFAWQEPGETADPPPITQSRDLGWMLYDLDFSNPASPRPLFFNARMEQGVIRVPERHSQEVRG